MSQLKLDPLSYTSQARLKVLLLPLKPIKRSRFEHYTQLVRQLNDIRLEDITIDKSIDYGAFNPKSLPSGRIIYDFVLEVDKEHAYLESFESSRRVFAILLIADGLEAHNAHEVEVQLASVHQSNPSAALSRIIVFDFHAASRSCWPPGTLQVAKEDDMQGFQHGPLREVMIAFTSLLLIRIKELYKVTQNQSNITSPYDPASDFIRPQAQRMSSYALGDAHNTPSASPAPGQQPLIRHSLGPGILGSSERAKVLSSGRAFKLCGDLLLVCGMCNEAIKHFAEAAAVARANNDHIWHGVALESIGVCLILFTFLKLPYQIPQVAQTASVLSFLSKKSGSQVATIGKSNVDLVDYLPELHSMVLNLYQKSISTQNDQIPPFVLAESTLRLSKLLATVHQASGLTQAALDHLVRGIPLDSKGRSVAAYPPRAEIAAWAMRAYQGPLDSLSLTDKVHIFSGLAAILGTIGFSRRRAFFLREILIVLVPALIQARVAGAAGKGIHPAASLAISEGQNQALTRVLLDKSRQYSTSLDSLLEDVLQSYGVPRACKEQELVQAILSGYGWPDLRNIVLKDCSSVCEAIPDFESVLRISARNLELDSANMERDEQVRLVSNIPRIVNAAKRSGVSHIELDYWDSYLVRGIQLEANIDSLPIPINLNELLSSRAPALVSGNTFLHNPYEKKSSILPDLSVVQHEPAYLHVFLQNPFAFDVEAQEVELVSEGVEIVSQPCSAYIKANSVVLIKMSCTAQTTGELRVLGCNVKMSGCKARLFTIRHAPTRAEIEHWHIQRGGIMRQKKRGISEMHTTTQNSLSAPDVVKINVLPSSPTLSHQVRSNVLVTASVLEGEYSSVTITLENISSTTINFLSFSFTDSTAKALKQAITSRTKEPHDVYELETFLYNRKAIWHKTSESMAQIPAQSSQPYQFEIFGKRGATMAHVMITYAYIPALTTSNKVSDQDQTGKCLTRCLTVPIRFVVQPSLEIIHSDLLSLPTPQSLPSVLQDCSQQFATLYAAIDQIEAFSLLILDIRNPQPQSMSLQIDLDNDTSEYTATTLVSGSSQSRILIPVRRRYLSLSELHEPIPSIGARQFIVSSVSKDVEFIHRENFWARESLLSRLSLKWTIGSRTGRVETRSLYMNRRMVEQYFLPPVSLSIDMMSDHEPDRVKVDEYCELNIVMQNRASQSERMMLRVSVTHEILQDLTFYFVILGTLQTALEISPGVTTHTMTCLPLMAGRYAVQASLTSINDPQSTIVSRTLEVEAIGQ